MKGRTFLFSLAAGAGISLAAAGMAFAAEKSDQSQWDLEQFDTDSVDEYLSRNQPEGVELSFTDLVVHLGKGEGKQAAEKIGAAVMLCFALFRAYRREKALFRFRHLC